MHGSESLKTQDPGLVSILSEVESFVEITVDISISPSTLTVDAMKKQDAAASTADTAKLVEVEQKSEFAYAFVVGGCDPKKPRQQGLPL
jgi:3-deoxy-D-arabino-heptulosonate 7-phosphate (DAHP) synthase class II